MAASNHEASTPDPNEKSEIHINGADEHTQDATPTANGKVTTEGTQEQAGESVFQLTIHLPHEPYKTQVMVSAQEQIQDLRQSIVDFPFTFQYSCFHLEHDGKRINDFVELSEISGITSKPELRLVEDPYTEKEARLHVVRVRELIGAAGDRTDVFHGVMAGLSLHDSVNPGGPDRTHPASNGQLDEVGAMGSYDFQAPGSLESLVPAPEEPSPKTVKVIALSSWNPPPYHLRSKGHLLYLQVTTNEGEQYQITAHVSGFYVNKSSNSKFDPLPKTTPKPYARHSLLALLRDISPSFDSAFKALQDYNGKKDPLAAFQLSNAIPASPWLVPPPTSAAMAHQADPTRSQESYLISGAESNDTLRDWNEEFQSTRELPKELIQDRVFRERIISKLFADFNEAATRGAALVARGEVAPLNPTEGRDAQIYIYNNVFFSYGADGVGTFANEGGDEAARVATGKDVMGVKAVNQLDIPGLFTPGTVVVDYLGKRLVGQSIVPGIFKQREPGEHQIDYGGVEGKDVVAEHDAFRAPFEQLSKAVHVKKHPVWDKDGKRHDLEGSVETKGLLGTDGRKYVLDLYRLTPLDVSWIEQHWCKKDEDGHSIEPNKDYPHRMAVLRPELVDAYWRTKLRDYVKAELAHRNESRNAVNGASEELRIKQKEDEPESTRGATDAAEGDATEDVSSKVGNSEAEPSKEDRPHKDAPLDNGVAKDNEQERVDVSGFKFALNPDVFSGQKPQTDDEIRQLAQDEAEVRAACSYLQEEVIPRLIQNLQEGDVGFPMDGQSLSNLLHKRGINVRYLGTIAKLADQSNPRLQALRRLSIQEMITRAFKHICNRSLRHLPPVFAAACVSHLLNCLLGSNLNPNPSAETDPQSKALYPDADFGFEKQDPRSLQEAIVAQVKQRYRFELQGNWTQQIKQVQMLREIALKLGFQFQLRDYTFSTSPSTVESDEPAAQSQERPMTNGVNGHLAAGAKKKRKGPAHDSPNRSNSTTDVIGHPAGSTTFHPDDIVNLVPVIKEASPKSALAQEALEAGQISIAQDQKELGQELLLESLSLHEQIYGILHPDVAKVYYQLSTLYYGLEEKNAAVELARKAVIVSERTLGVDSADTILSYLNLGLFEHANGNTKGALAYVRHALNLWKIVYGINHPDSITTMNNAAVMLQHLKRYHESRIWFEASLAISEEVSGKNSVNTATLLFQLAQALALDQDAKGAVNRMRDAYNIFNTELGPNDRNTKEAETWLEQLTQNAVTIAKHAKDVQARRLRRIHLTPRVTLGTRPQPQVGQSSSEAVTGRGSGTSVVLDPRSVDELLKYIEGADGAKPTTPKKRTTNPKRRRQQAP